MRPPRTVSIFRCVCAILAYLYCFTWAYAICVSSSLTPLPQEIIAVAKVKVVILSLLS